MTFGVEETILLTFYMYRLEIILHLISVKEGKS